MDPLTKLGIGVSGVIALGVLIWLLFRSWGKGKEQIGADKVIHETRETVIEDMEHAKRVRETLASDRDAEWLKRVREQFRRR